MIEFELKQACERLFIDRPFYRQLGNTQFVPESRRDSVSADSATQTDDDRIKKQANFSEYDNYNTESTNPLGPIGRTRSVCSW